MHISALFPKSCIIMGLSKSSESQHHSHSYPPTQPQDFYFSNGNRLKTKTKEKKTSPLSALVLQNQSEIEKIARETIIRTGSNKESLNAVSSVCRLPKPQTFKWQRKHSLTATGKGKEKGKGGVRNEEGGEKGEMLKKRRNEE